MENTSIRPLILISNDDSIDAPGIHHLARTVRSMGDVIVVAPAHPHSGQSAALTVGSPLRISEKPCDIDGVRMFTVTGTPVDCIKLGLHAIVPRKPDLVLAGINHGSNSGVNVTYSGTMGAVLEACLEGIPAVGFSLLHHSIKADFTLSTAFVADITAKVLSGGLPKGICLNVNIPAKVIPEGIKVCRARAGGGQTSTSAISTRSECLFTGLPVIFVNEEPGCRRYRRILAHTPLCDSGARGCRPVGYRVCENSCVAF